ncbi:hypothetical protein [Sphingomonas sp. ERG5]|uniref:hypothetical protein n=1 Tax=Sphingomonas sp. ERG5 TaxID=1381597 RepID=UPI00054BE35C|nr:hypothetical protein [Sphingomonas sp. ERG5]
MSVARIYRTGSPYNGNELAEIDFEQSADTMYLAHIDHKPNKLVRTGHSNWAFSDIAFTPTLPAPTGLSVMPVTGNSVVSGDSYFPQPATYIVTSVNDVTGVESRPSLTPVTVINDLTLKRNYNSISWIGATGATRYRVFKADNTQEYGYIGTTTSQSFTDDNIGPDYSDGPPLKQNPFEVKGDWPSTVTFIDQRLLWGRTANHPNAIYGSRSGSFENMDISRPLKASDSLSFALVAGRVNAVNQLVSMNSLLALTSDSIFKIEGGQSGYISATDFVVRRQNGRGSSRLSPLVVDSVCFYQTSVGNGVRTLGYQFQTDSIDSNDVTIFSPHLFRGFDIKAWAYAQEPRSIIWAVRSDGKLLCFTWEQEQQVWGWTLCETDGSVESVCVVSEGTEDRLYLTVRRNGKLLIERMAATRWAEVEDCCFLDSAVTYQFEEPAAILRNLDHLEGKTISALADGKVVSGLVVTGGVVTLPFAVRKVTAGLPYSATIETLPLAVQGQSGWTVAKVQSQARAVIRVIDSRGLKAGPTDTTLEPLRGRTREMPGQPNALRTGLLETYLRPDLNGGARVIVRSDDPLPMTISAIYLDPSVSE